MKKLSYNALIVTAAALLLVPYAANAQETAGTSARDTRVAAAQQNVPPQVRDAADATERAVKRFRIGVDGGIALDPELIDFGAHATFAPVFTPSLEFRPGIEFGLGEVTTLFAINLDVLYTLPGTSRDSKWTPYVGAGPNFSLSHRGFETDEGDHVSATTDSGTPTTTATDTPGRFDFSDTDFSGGFNFIAGARSQSGLFIEMKATAWGVSNVRLLAGFNF